MSDESSVTTVFDYEDFYNSCQSLGFESRKIWVELADQIIVHLGDQKLMLSSPFHRKLFEHRVKMWPPYMEQQCSLSE